jgi:hypothetical protein
VKISNGAPALLSASIAALIVSFLPWQSVEVLGFSISVDEWHGIGVLCGLLALALVVWNALRLANVTLPVPVPPALVGLPVAALLVLLTLIKVVAIDDRTGWAWLGLVLAVLIAVAAYLEAAPMLRMFQAMRSGTLPGVVPSAPRPAPTTTSERSGAVSGIDGEWQCTMDTPMGEQSVALTLSTEGGALSGQANTAFGVNAFDGGTVDGNDIAWHITATQPMPLELDFKATVDGDALTGTVHAGPFGESAFKGTRV